ncbi:biotin--[acetyl-CoA-carboxylase] ligase [bacterium]|nr:biotin--[acetyl-CoA-carboxylase] ligase [bacterium]
MPTKKLIVHNLLNNKWISGVDLAKKCAISRTAVWNNIVSLKKKGYSIESDNKLGYKLSDIPPYLYPELVSYNLKCNVIGKKIIHFMSTGSTNIDAMNLALKGEKEGTVIIAQTQTAGKGRFNRQWESIPDKSLAFSIILKPYGKSPRQAYQFTVMAAVSIIEAVCEFTGLKPKIKWPNDIYLNNKKIAGILTELNADTDLINFIILGIGINVNQSKKDFSENLSNASSIACVLNKPIDRLAFLKLLLFYLDKRYNGLIQNKFHNLYNEWQNFSYPPGTKIFYSANSSEGSGVIEKINEDGALSIRTPCDEIISIYSGHLQIL